MIPTKGIHVQSAMRYLFRRLITNDTLTDSYPRADMYNTDAHHFGGGSENMKLLYCAVGYIANLTAGRDRLLNWYANEQGHGGGETITASHDQLHLGGHSAIALHAYQTQDDLVFVPALKWLGIRYHLYSLCEVNGEPWTPGSRGVLKGKVIGENPTRGKWLRAIREGKSPKPNQYDLGACCVAKLPIDARVKISDKIDYRSITIQGDLSITRLPNGTFAAVFNSLPIGGGGVQCAGYDGIDKWIYRDANTPEAAVKIGQVSRKSGNTQVEHYKSPTITDIDHKRPKRDRKEKSTMTRPNSLAGMPVKENEFSRAQLWPESNHRWMASGAMKSIRAQYPIENGEQLDYGALKVEGGIWKILDRSGMGWKDFNPQDSQHELAANAFNRYRAGWSFGPAHNQHAEDRNLFKIVYGREPTLMERMDHRHDKELWDALVIAAKAKTEGESDGDRKTPKVEPIKPPNPPTKPEPIKPPVVIPPSPPIDLSLSSIEQRTQEIVSLIPVPLAWVPRFIMEALPRMIMETVRAKRRMEDRIVSRVIEEMKKVGR